MLIAMIAVRASSGVGVNRNECKCGDEDDRGGSGDYDGAEVGTWPPGAESAVSD